MNCIRKIVSGGQSGVDRAALDFAIAHNIPYGGYVPRGGRAEDLPNPPGLLALYPEMREHTSREWGPRTAANVVRSSVTMIVRDPDHEMGPGTKRTINIAKECGKPLVIARLDDAEGARRALESIGESLGTPFSLNVAGSRESGQPGIYVATLAFLEEILTPLLVTA